MTDAFIETTVITDYLLKKDGSEKRAAATFNKFNCKIVPQFAWKEFKRGPLKNFVWAHNKLADTRSFLETLAALQRMSRTPQRYLTATAIQALHSAFTALFDNLDTLKTQYGTKADPDRMHADALRLEIKRVISSSWNIRRHSGWCARARKRLGALPTRTSPQAVGTPYSDFHVADRPGGSVYLLQTAGRG